MTMVEPIANESVQSESEVECEQLLSPTPIDRILQKLSCIELPAKDHLERYMHHKWRLNHKPNRLRNSLKAIELFLTLYTRLGKSQLKEIVRDDLDAFVEKEGGFKDYT
jgi:hypothetical protein